MCMKILDHFDFLELQRSGFNANTILYHEKNQSAMIYITQFFKKKHLYKLRVAVLV